MFLNAYTFLDTKTGIHSAPFFVPHEAIALRYAVDLGNDLNTSIGKYAADYVLFHVGQFDDNAGVLLSSPARNLGVIAALTAASKGETK